LQPARSARIQSIDPDPFRPIQLHIGNILTVAEDLLENDGKKFLEMMDRLADRKVQRDDDLMDNRGVYEEYDDEDDGEFEDDGPEEVIC